MVLLYNKYVYICETVNRFINHIFFYYELALKEFYEHIPLISIPYSTLILH